MHRLIWVFEVHIGIDGDFVYLQFFDGVPIEDRRIFDLLCKTPLPLPTTLLMECVTGWVTVSRLLSCQPRVTVT